MQNPKGLVISWSTLNIYEVPWNILRYVEYPEIACDILKSLEIL